MKLDTTSLKYVCPKCGKKRFVRYIPSPGDEYGRCDRSDSCGYFLKPNRTKPSWTPEPVEPQKPVYVPWPVLQSIQKGYANNTFVQNLLKQYEPRQVQTAVAMYQLGTLKDGSVAFPYIDEHGQINSIEAILYNETNHRTGNPKWIHKLLPQDSPWLQEYLRLERKTNCLFGAHLAHSAPNAIIAIVEAPKTAVIASIEFPECIWMASFNVSSLAYYKVKALAGRRVILYPDLKAEELWTQKAQEFNQLMPDSMFTVSNALRDFASPDDVEQGLDLADFLQEEPR